MYNKYSVQRTAYSVQRTAYSVQRTAYAILIVGILLNNSFISRRQLVRATLQVALFFYPLLSDKIKNYRTMQRRGIG